MTLCLELNLLVKAGFHLQLQTYCDLLARLETPSAFYMYLEINISFYFSSCLCSDKWLSLPTEKSICIHTLSQITLSSLPVLFTSKC